MTIVAVAIAVVCAVAGALMMRGTGDRSRALTIGSGALGGSLGALALSAPLGFCTFEADRPTKDLIFGILLMVGGAYLGVRAARAALSPTQDRPEFASHGNFGGGRWVPWLLLAPTLAVLVVFLYWPAARTIGYSTRLARRTAPRTAPRCVSNFTELIGPSRPWLTLVFAGLAVIAIVGSRVVATRSGHWAEIARSWLSVIGVGAGLVVLAFLFTDSYRKVYVVTMIISGGIVIGGLVIALGIAFVAYQPIRGASVYRTLLVWPYAISPPIAGLIFFVMFDANTGIIDYATRNLIGWDLPDYRSNGLLAQLVVILASIWKTLGYNLLFYIAGLQTIPKDQIEAAMIDGAGAWARFRHIVIPALSPVTFFLIVTNLTYAFFETYGTIDYLTRGGPAGDTSVAMYEIIRVFSTEGDLGRGAAQSMLLFAGVVGLTMWQFQTTGKRVHYGS